MPLTTEQILRRLRARPGRQPDVLDTMMDMSSVGGMGESGQIGPSQWISFLVQNGVPIQDALAFAGNRQAVTKYAP